MTVDLVDEAEVLQVVDALLGLGVGADDGAALEGVEHLGGVEAQHRQVAVRSTLLAAVSATPKACAAS